MTEWKTRLRQAVSSSAPRCGPSSAASASVSGVNPEMSAKSAAPWTRSGSSMPAASARRRSPAMYASGLSKASCAFDTVSAAVRMSVIVSSGSWSAASFGDSVSPLSSMDNTSRNPEGTARSPPV